MKQQSDINRRDFLVGGSLSLGWVAGHQWLSHKDYRQRFMLQADTRRQVVIYHDSAHFDTRPVFEPYLPPVDPASSTRRYVESLSETEFLRRHWFV